MGSDVVCWIVLGAALLSVFGMPSWAAPGSDDDRLVLDGSVTGIAPTDAPGRGRHIVFVSGDEEYRSEEALPQLAAILAERHGFRCTVLFAIDPESGEIDPDIRTNVPGLEALADADLLVIATRFRDLPDASMRHIDAYLRSGRPVVGLRTATHGFAMSPDSSFAHYSWNHDNDDFRQGFGRQILGETWIAHHGQHGVQATRGVVAADRASHPIVRGIAPGSIFGPTDVYRVRLPLPDPCEAIVFGEVLEGMQQDDAAAAGEVNDPKMPIAWTSSYAIENGPCGLVFTTTMGAATDLVAEGTRRLIVQGVFWALGLADAIPSEGLDVGLVGRFEPTSYGFGGFVPGRRPADLDPTATIAPTLDLSDGDTLLVLGATFADRIAESGYLDALAHAAHPGRSLTVRCFPWSADEVGLRPREVNVPPIESHVRDHDPDALLMFYGMSESFAGPDGLDAFRRDLTAFVDSVSTRDDGTRRRVVLVSPIAHEDLGDPWPTGRAIERRNASVRAYRDAMRDVAIGLGVGFLDLFEPTETAVIGLGRALTANGIHPTEWGSQRLVEAIGRELGWLPSEAGGTDRPDDAAIAQAERLRLLAADKHYHAKLAYRPTNTEYVWGRRAEPFGVVNFPPEMAQLDRMVDARERAMREAAMSVAPASLFARPPEGPTLWETLPSDDVRLPEDSWEPQPVEAKGTETSLGSLEIADPDAFVESFTIADGYRIECFASEQDFADLANPLALTFDDRHRMWVLCAMTYPHLMPGEAPRCKLLIFEDRDGDGRADHRTVFADRLYVPTGFAVDRDVEGRDVVWIGQAPDLLRLRDTDGDGISDRRDVVLSGFAMPDSHHTLSAFEWAPDGGILMHEGIFCVSGVETAYGTRRIRDAAVWHFDPRMERLEPWSHCGFLNPWGHAFDDFGASVVADASGGENFAFSHVAHAFTYPKKPKRPGPILNRGRPTAGCEILLGRHFPDDVQGSFVVNQSIGFHGTRWDRLVASESSWRAERMPQDLVACSDTNFRPVGVEMGPDGAIYIADWCNPIIGHMQYSVRDPRRDHEHGRIWRVRHETRPLVTPPRIDGASARDALAMLSIPERNTRQLVRRHLQRMPRDVVLLSLRSWIEGLPATAVDRERLLLEGIWIAEAHGVVELDRVDTVLGAFDARVRAEAVRYLRRALQTQAIDESSAVPRLELAARDDDLRVRLESIIASGFLSPESGARILGIAAESPLDGPSRTVFRATLEYLGPALDSASDAVRRLVLETTPLDELRTASEGGDAIADSVLLGRSDAELDERREALVRLAGDDAIACTERLVAELDDAVNERARRAVGSLLVESPGEGVAAVRESLVARLGSPSEATRAAVRATLFAQGTEVSRALDATAADISRALAMLDPGRAPAAALERLRTTIENAEAIAAADRVDLHAAVREIGRHGGDTDGATAWLEARVARVTERSLAEWSSGHEVAMAAVGSLLDRESENAFGITPVAAERLARGRAIYEAAETGCARCHGYDGNGIEGFPALAGSPWILGRPERAAAVVVHGLFGALTMPDGELFASAMAPLGAELDDAEIADVLTYTRRAWGNVASAVSADVVARVRAAPPETGLWEASALLATYPLDRDALFGRELAAPPTPLTDIASSALEGGVPGEGLEAPAGRRSGAASIGTALAIAAALGLLGLGIGWILARVGG